MSFSYDAAVTHRPGRGVTLAGLLVPGVARVQRDVGPFAAAWQRDNLAAARGDGPLWVALGDSLTQGIGAGAHDRGWVGQVRDRLAAAGRDHRVINLAVSGAKTADVLAEQLPVLQTLSPDLVTLMIGSNDLLRPRNRRGLPERFEQILRRLPYGSLVTTLPNPTPAAVAANAVLMRVAAERGLVVAELRDPRTSSWKGRLAPDHFHPNEDGYAAIAEIVGDVLLRDEQAA